MFNGIENAAALVYDLRALIIWGANLFECVGEDLWDLPACVSNFGIANQKSFMRRKVYGEFS